MKKSIFSGLMAVSLISLSLHAQLPTESGALKVGELLPGALGIRIEDQSRTLKDDGVSGELDMLRITASMQVELTPGIYPWIEAGWHDPELQSGKSSGGFTWGAGLHTRPLLKALRSDPVLGPRDWIALVVDLAVRGGEADADAGKIEWMNLEGVIGMEWHQKYLGRNDGPIGAHDITAGVGMILNSFEGSQGSFDGSEEQSIGLRANTGFTFSKNTFLNLELDLYGSSDRRLSLISGFKF